MTRGSHRSSKVTLRLAGWSLALLAASLLPPAGAQAAAACPPGGAGCPMMQSHAAPPPCHGTAVTAGDCCAVAPEAVPAQAAGRELTPPAGSDRPSPGSLALPTSAPRAAAVIQVLARSGAPPLYTLYSSLLN